MGSDYIYNIAVHDGSRDHRDNHFDNSCNLYLKHWSLFSQLEDSDFSNKMLNKVVVDIFTNISNIF